MYSAEGVPTATDTRAIRRSLEPMFEKRRGRLPRRT